MKDLIKLLEVLKEKYFSSCLTTWKKEAEKFLHKINVPDTPLWDSKKETLHGIMINLGALLKDI